MTTTPAPEGWDYVRGEELAKLETDLVSILGALDSPAYADHAEAERDRLRDKAQGLLSVVRDSLEYLALIDPPETRE